ncbi:TPA: phage minor tail protein L, partial [Pseudomonas aeruginosa]|nr:phage minor tail protein L [Pseudomonas aeruginosa]HEK0892119.1 phage minor tail protein L [Pseudomonas aeruginosa]
IWYLDQKTNEDGQYVAWELASPGDVGGEQVGRQMTTLCHWAMTGGYRGPDCGYTGPYFDIDGNPTDDPARDECDGCLGTGCIPRFGEGNQLPFGGFPAVSIIARS